MWPFFSVVVRMGGRGSSSFVVVLVYCHEHFRAWWLIRLARPTPRTNNASLLFMEGCIGEIAWISVGIGVLRKLPPTAVQVGLFSASPLSGWLRESERESGRAVSAIEQLQDGNSFLRQASISGA